MHNPERENIITTEIKQKARSDAELFLIAISKYMPENRIQPFHDIPLNQKKYTGQAGTETILPVLVSDAMQRLPEDQKIAALFLKAKEELKFSGVEFDNLYFQEFFQRLSKGYPQIKH